MSHTTARPRQADTSLDSQTMIGRQRESDPWRERWSSACRWAARPMMTTLACKAGVVCLCRQAKGIREALPERGRSGTRATPRAQVHRQVPALCPVGGTGGIDTGSSRATQWSVMAGRRSFVPPTTDSLPACRSVPPPSNSFARCVVALYSPPTQIWWGGGPGGGSRPHRGRCPSRLLPMRGAAASGSVASRHREPTIDSCTSGPNRCRRDSSGGILTRWHRFGPSLSRQRQSERVR